MQELLRISELASLIQAQRDICWQEHLAKHYGKASEAAAKLSAAGSELHQILAKVANDHSGQDV